jgi:hypothetical protein
MNMSKNFTRSIAALALMNVLAFAPALLAQGAPASGAAKTQPAFDPHDLSGQWSGGLGGGLHSIGKPPDMMPEAQSRFTANTAELKTTVFLEFTI